MTKMKAYLAVLILLGILSDQITGLSHKQFELPKSFGRALNKAVAVEPREKRNPIAAAMAKPLAEAAGDLLKQAGSKVLDGVVSIVTGGSRHVAEAEERANEHNKEGESGAEKAHNKAQGYGKATISLRQRKGEVGFGDTLSVVPPGFQLSARVSKEKKEPEENGPNSYFMQYPMGLGVAMLNGCYLTGYQEGDPCYVLAKLTVELELCLDILPAALFIGVGFDGRGDYSADYRKKSVIQRLCANKFSFGGYLVPDTMNVFGIYDTEAEQMAFSSSNEFQTYLETKAAVSSYKFSFKEAMMKTFGVSLGFTSLSTSGSTKSSKSKQSSTQAASYANGNFAKEKQTTFMSMLEVKIIRFEIFMDEVKPTDLSQAFMADFGALPESYFATGAPLKYQNFILRWGTHYIKSAKFGGHLRLTRTKTFAGSANYEEFSQKANSDTQALFSNSYSSHSSKTSLWGGHSSKDTFNSNTEGHGESTSESKHQTSETKQSTSYNNEYMLVEGGSQEIASILSDFYSPSFKDTFTSWLESIPEYPKPFEFRMGTLGELLDISVIHMFNQGVKLGCVNSNTKSKDGKYYYEVNVTNTHDNSTNIERRYCEHGRTPEELQEAIDKRRRSLLRSIAIYMDEGPIPAFDINLKAGSPGCETRNLLSASGKPNSLIPKWSDMTNGVTFKVIFDAAYDIPNIALKRSILYVHFADGIWYSKTSHSHYHLFSGFNNGKSTDKTQHKISINGLLMTYNENNGIFTIKKEDFEESNSTLHFLPGWLSENKIARAQYMHPMELVKNEQDTRFSVKPCNIEFKNSYKFEPMVEGGRCVKFTAASKGDIFVVFASIPRKHDFWYLVQITPSGVAFYKAMQLVKKDFTPGAMGLGLKNLYQTYFVCIIDETDSVTINYGIAKENTAAGDIFMTWTDNINPLHVKYYAFGSGDEEVNIMDIHVISSKSMSQFTCREKVKNGLCVPDCHEQCDGCKVKRSDLDCVACRNYRVPRGSGFRCVAQCPANMTTDSGHKTCTCNLSLEETPNECLSECPQGRPKINHKCQVPRPSCSTLWEEGKRKDGVYLLKINGFTFKAYCEFDRGGWTRIQRREDGSVDFHRIWAEYKNGFGNVQKEHWLGNENIFYLTNRRNQMLKIDFETWDGKRRFEQYDSFMISDETNKYQLHIKTGSGNAGDSLTYHNNMYFSTKDRDNSLYHDCSLYNSAWWYNDCSQSDLNSGYPSNGTCKKGACIIWNALQKKNGVFTGLYFKTITMKIKDNS